MSQEKRIPLSRRVRWQRFRLQAIPVLSFCMALVAVGWLWRQYGSVAQGVGEVDSPRVEVTSPTAGLVLSLPHQTRGQWKIYDHVEAGDVMARIEDKQVENNNSLVRQDIVRLLAQLEQHKTKVTDNKLQPADKEAVRSAWQYEQSRLLSLDEQLAFGSQITLDENREPAAAPPELPDAISANLRDDLARLRESRKQLELRVKEVRDPTQSLEILSPISGTLVAVHCTPGQTVPTGGRIATIAADYGRHIVGYIPEGNSLDVKPGMRVTLRTHTAGSRLLTSQIEQVGRRVERIPTHQVAASKTPQWGTPVRIKMPSDAMLQPGALLDVVFNRSNAQ